MKKQYLYPLTLALACSFVASTPLAAAANRHVPIRTQILSLEEENESREKKAQEDEENIQLLEQIPESERPVCQRCGGKKPPVEEQTENPPIEENGETPQLQDQIPENEHSVCQKCGKKPLVEEEQPTNPPLEEEQVANGVYYHSSHPDGFHQAVNISPNGSAIETEDGAIYTVKWSDRHKTCNWQPYHTILLAPNRSWFSSYYFNFINLETGEKAAVNMSLGPIYENIKTHWIEAIDVEDRIIRLEDNSLWSVSWLDQETLKTLDRYDVVIIGTNDGWWKTSNPNVLIAVKSFQYVRGSKVN